MLSIIIFVVLNLVNVVLGTMRSILTVKASPTVAMLINTISYTFYSAIVKLTTGQELWLVLATTAITNIIGVYAATWILKIFEKDKLWVIDITCNRYDCDKIISKLDIFKIGSVVFDTVNGKYIKVFSYSQRDSARIKRILKDYKVKYNIVENKGIL